MIEDQVEKTGVDIVNSETEIEVAVEKGRNREKDTIIINTRQDK
jgi:hypothetical protein